MKLAPPHVDPPLRRYHRASRQLVWQTALIIAMVFAALAPTLSWPQFSGDSEDLIVQTVLQIHNGGPKTGIPGGSWWIPVLGDQPRFKKPPLPTWIAAAAVTHATVRDLSSTDPATRESAYRWLAWEMRWPSLVAACGMLIAIAFTANLVGGPAHVIPAVLIFSTSLIVLSYIRSATTDVHLTLWVLVANAFLAAAVLRDRIWIGCLGAGTALGIALMCKGPVALAETLLPVAAFLLLRGRTNHTLRPIPLAHSRYSASLSRRTIPILCGIIAMLALGLPWYISVLFRYPQTIRTWLTEIDRRGAAVASHAPWFSYLTLLPNLLPWLPIFIAGIYLATKDLRHCRSIALALMLLVVPIVFLSFFPDRKERYILPMAAPAAILAAHAATRMKRSQPSRNGAARPINREPGGETNGDAASFLTSCVPVSVPAQFPASRPDRLAAKLVWGSHWAILLVFAIGVPIAGGIFLKGPQGEKCYPIALQEIVELVSIPIVIAGIALQCKHRQSFLFAGFALMLVLNAFFIFGWSQSISGLSEMKPVADRLHAAFPGQQIVYFDPPPDGKPVTLDLDIYLDRPVPVLDTMPPADGTVAAVVMLRKDGDPVPNLPGWKNWSDLLSRKHHWYMLTPAG